MEEKLQQLYNQLQETIRIQGDILELIKDLQKKVEGLQNRINRLDSRTDSLQVVGTVAKPNKI